MGLAIRNDIHIWMGSQTLLNNVSIRRRNRQTYTRLRVQGHQHQQKGMGTA